MTRFLRNTSLSDIENAYLALGTAASKVLSLPNGFDSEGGLGITGALIQYLAAWSRTHKDATLSVSGDPRSPDIANLAAEPYGAAAIYFASKVQFHSGETLSRQEARRYLLPSVKAMQSWNLRATMKARGVHLVSYGGAVNEFILPLYARRDEDSLRSESGFLGLIEKTFEAFMPVARGQLPDDGVSLIAQIVFELFSNTHEHARLTETNKRYDENIRGILFRELEYRVSLDSKTLVSDSPTQQYFARIATKRAHHKPDAASNEERVNRILKGIQEAPRSLSKSSTRFLEITIYDAGPGLARNWARRKLDTDISALALDVEETLVQRCFEMHMTTKPGKGRGAGLTGTIEFLRSLNAFMVLRTGRLLLYQDFSKDKSFALSHWKVRPPPLFEAPGASYTLAIPLGTNRP